MSDAAFAVVLIAAGSLFAVVSWFWSIPFNSSFELMLTGKVRNPQRYRAGRLMGTILGVVFAQLGIQFLVRTLGGS